MLLLACKLARYAWALMCAFNAEVRYVVNYY
jgi:hypothetical protein